MMNKEFKCNIKKVCIPTSSGGHLTHMMMIKDVFKEFDRVWVTFNKEDANSQLKNEKVYYCYYPTNRNIINLIKNTFVAWKVLKKEKPDMIISSGAAISIPFFFLGKVFFHSKCVYIEVFDRINKGTIAGKFCYRFADLFIVQWKEQLKVYPNGKYFGSIF